MKFQARLAQAMPLVHTFIHLPVSVMGMSGTSPSPWIAAPLRRCGRAAGDQIMGTTTIDSVAPYGFLANPPSSLTFANFYDHTVSCKTFEMWGVASQTGLHLFRLLIPASISGTQSQPVHRPPRLRSDPITVCFRGCLLFLPLRAASGHSWLIPADKLNNKWGTTEFRRTSL